jgi:hypothetical protein
MKTEQGGYDTSQPLAQDGGRFLMTKYHREVAEQKASALPCAASP